MSGDGEFDQCPFCNAAWGDCMHVKLLAELDKEAVSRLSPEPSASTPSGVNVNTSGKEAALSEKGKVIPFKPISASG
ncbi:hypothetical protein [Hoeflea sp.]|uniref:hypothetical protein n=1 Tax=Hoeflea sp. TaxID=1940281 RepID=UPI003A959606